MQPCLMSSEETDPDTVPGVEAKASPRWFRARSPEQRTDYASRFVRLTEQGEDIDGEARLIDAILPRGSAILDAGCGVGRVAAYLAGQGHQAVGVDADPVLVEAGRRFYPGLPLAVIDLAELTSDALTDAGLPGEFDLIVCPGNVMHFVAEGSEPRVLRRLAEVLRSGGRAVFGFATEAEAGPPEGRTYAIADLDRDAAAAGWTLEHRFGTWQLDAFAPDSTWAVSVYRAG